VHVGADWTIRCETYPDTTPILTVGGGPVAVSFSIAALGSTAGREAA